MPTDAVNNNNKTIINVGKVERGGVDDLSPEAGGSAPVVKSDVPELANPAQPTVSSKVNATMKQFETNPKLLAEYTISSNESR